jgi:hypothetical protein
MTLVCIYIYIWSVMLLPLTPHHMLT